MFKVFRKKYLLPLIISILLSISTSFYGANQAQAKVQEDINSFTIYPSYTHQQNTQWIIQETNSGNTIRDFVTIENLSSQPKTLSIFFREATNQDNQFTPIESNQFQNLGNWFKAQSTVTLAGHQKTKVPVTFMIPENANPQTYNGVIFAQETHTNQQNPSLNISVRQGVRTFITIPTPNSSLLTTPDPVSPLNSSVLLITIGLLFASGTIILCSQHRQKITLCLMTILISTTSLNSAQAQIIEVEITQGGYILRGPSHITFDQISASFEDRDTIVKFRNLPKENFLEVEDLSGGTPFSVNVSASDFTSDNGIISNQNFFVRNHDGSNPDLQVINGSSEGVELNPSTDDFSPLNETQTLFDRLSGQEPGKWRFFPELKLKINSNQKSGIYTTNITFTII